MKRPIVYIYSGCTLIVRKMTFQNSTERRSGHSRYLATRGADNLRRRFDFTTDRIGRTLREEILLAVTDVTGAHNANGRLKCYSSIVEDFDDLLMRERLCLLGVDVDEPARRFRQREALHKIQHSIFRNLE